MPEGTAAGTPTHAGRYGAEGINTGDFNPGDWGLLLVTSVIWGSSFLWIAIGLDAFRPGVIAAGRMIVGAAVLWMVPAARKPIPRSAWLPLAVVAVAGNTFPAAFFPLAQTRVESSVAGMLNSVGPILTLILSVLMLGKAPPRRQIVGLGIGMAGAVLLSAANLSGADAEPLGVLFVFLAITGYSISNNFLPRLAQDWGGPAVIARAMTASALLLLPWGMIDATRSSFAWKSAAALVILGVFGTGLARTIFAVLNGRIGAPRSALVGYLVPLVAVTLGVVVRGESVSATELAATGLIIAGAALISRT